jgi:hypothetical protein
MVNEHGQRAWLHMIAEEKKKERRKLTRNNDI